MQRPAIQETLSLSKRLIKDHDQLRKKVATFVNKCRLPAVSSYIQTYKEVVEPVIGETWSEYWKRMSTDMEWADDITVQGTAWYFNRDIYIIWSNATIEQPYWTKSGHYTSENTACEGLPLLMGYKEGLHYQSLLPTTECASRPQFIEPLHQEDILKKIIVEHYRNTRRIQEEVQNERDKEGLYAAKKIGEETEELLREIGNSEETAGEESSSIKRKLDISSIAETNTDIKKKNFEDSKESARKDIEKVLRGKGESALLLRRGDQNYQITIGEDSKVTCPFCQTKLSNYIEKHFEKCSKNIFIGPAAEISKDIYMNISKMRNDIKQGRKNHRKSENRKSKIPPAERAKRLQNDTERHKET